MKKAFIFLLLCSVALLCQGQESLYTCDRYGIRIPHRSIRIDMGQKSKQLIEQKIFAFIKARKYLYKPYFSGDNRISFRDFTLVCDKKTCGSDIYAKIIFQLDYSDGWVNVSSSQEIYSSFHGGKLIINGNDDVASVNDIPFGNYEFEIAEKYADEFPEAIYTYDKRNRIRIQNLTTKNKLQQTFDNYIRDLRTFLEK